jgi:hypothetical protein
MNSNPYIIPWNWLSHVKKDDDWIVGKTSLYKLINKKDYWVTSKILLTLTHLTQPFKTYNSAHVPDPVNDKSTHPYTAEPVRCYLLHRALHTIQGSCICFILYLIWIIPCQVNQIFSIQIPEWNFPYVRPR